MECSKIPHNLESLPFAVCKAQIELSTFTWNICFTTVNHLRIHHPFKLQVCLSHFHGKSGGVISGLSFNKPVSHSKASTSRGPGLLKCWLPSTATTLPSLTALNSRLQKFITVHKDWLRSSDSTCPFGFTNWEPRWDRYDRLPRRSFLVELADFYCRVCAAGCALWRAGMHSSKIVNLTLYSFSQKQMCRS